MTDREPKDVLVNDDLRESARPLASAADQQRLRQLFAAVGEVEVPPDMDGVTARWMIDCLSLVLATIARRG
jgi:hypothetical protein